MTRPTSRTLARQLGETTELLAQAGAVLAERVTAIEDAMVGHPRSGSYEPHGHGGVSDRTGNDALQPDPAARDLDHLATTIRDLHRKANDLADLLARYGSRTATNRERSETAYELGHRDDGCASCARVHSSPGVARWTAMWKRLRVTSTAEPLPLCRWCGDRLRTLGRWPTIAELEAHWRSERVRVS